MSTRAVVPMKSAAAPARTLTRVPSTQLQRKCDCGGSAEHEGECEDCKKKKLQRRATGHGPGTAPPIVHTVLRSPGQPLDEQTRSFFEPRFGHDFSKVRVHADSRAHESAQAVNALAYTVGNDLVFSAGQLAPGTKSGQRLLAHELTHVVQQSKGGAAAVQRKLEVGAANDSLEQEADRFAEQITSENRVTSGWPIPPPSNGQSARVQRAADSASAAATVPPNVGLIVEDEATTVGPGQMRKSEFLEGLRTSVCATADSVLVAMGRTAQGCPLIERWIAKLRTRNAQYIERAIRKYAPEGANASTARDYFAAVGNHVRQGVSRWATTGEISGVPPELMSELAGGGILGAIAGTVSSVAGALGSAVSGIGKLFTKARDGGAREANPVAVQAQLGAGTILDGGVKGRMETAFGHSFARVRVHADSRAAGLSAGLNARAFTIGSDVAFAAGEYRPGTLIGDALIAHELAHVMQQRDGVSSEAPMAKGGNEYNSLEEDADVSAVGAMVSLWTGAKTTLKNIRANAMPRLRSGLRLQRCGGARAAAQEPTLTTNPNLRHSWEVAFQEGLTLLNASISQKGQSQGCKFPGNKKPEEWAYDAGSWTLQTGGEEIRKYRIAYLPKKRPHESVDDLFNHLDRWECDCALFSELTWLYAWRHTLPDQKFDEKFSDLRLRPQESTGLQRETHKAENIDLGIEKGNFGQMWRDAPVGTKVVWKNTSPVARSPWEFENAVRSFKGASDETDRYDAHPLGANLSETEVKRGLAENASDFPGNAFTVTGNSLQQLTAAGAPAPFVSNLQALVGQTFVGKPAFVEALKQPAQALIQMRQQDRAKYDDLLKKVFEFSHSPATEEQKKAYVEANIVRWEIQIPK